MEVTLLQYMYKIILIIGIRLLNKTYHFLLFYTYLSLILTFSPLFHQAILSVSTN
jgi:hypothetical protein